MSPGWIAAALVFLITYGLIFSERVHRTIAGLAGGVAMISAGIGLGFYDFDLAVKAVDFNTIGLLLGMMVIVGILQPTGFFQYAAIKLAQLTGGRGPLLFLFLAGFTTLVSTILDNVTTVVVIAPVTVSIAEVLGVSPVPLLLAEAVLSDVGGVATLVGDPPNILIGSASGLSFNQFLAHLGPVVLTVLFFSFLLSLWLFRGQLIVPEERLEFLRSLDPRRALEDPRTMQRVLWVLALTVGLYFVHDLLGLPPGLVALIGASVGLLWVRPEVDQVMVFIHWDVLLFFMGLFVVVGGLESAGVLGAISQGLAGVAGRDALPAALLILWSSAFMSAVVDNIPFTIAMIPVIKGLGLHGIPVEPLWWALAMGVGFGGNATPIGSTANVVVVSVSERTREPITFRRWFASATWISLLSCIIGSLFLILGISTGWYL